MPKTTPLSFSADSPNAALSPAGDLQATDSSLLALALGIPETQASLVLLRLGGLAALPGTSPSQLLLRGLSPRVTRRLTALHELATRLARLKLPRDLLHTDPRRTAAYLHLRYAGPEELLGALFLDSRGLLVVEQVLFRGTLDRLAVEPAPILRLAFHHQASGLLLFHNHPSANPTPSSDDLCFTRRMAEACAVTGLRLVDHLILGDAATFTSLRERGLC